MTTKPNESVADGSQPKLSSRGMAYLWIGITAGFAFLTALYIGFVR